MLHVPTGAVEAFGPTHGPQAVRDAAGPRGSVTLVSAPGDATDWTGLSRTNISTADSTATIQSKIDADATGRIWWAAGVYRLTTQLNLTKGSTTYRLERPAKGTTLTTSNTAYVRGSRSVSSAGWTNNGDGTWTLGSQTQDFSSNASLVLGSSENANYLPAYQELEAYWSDGNMLFPRTSAGAVASSTDKRYMNRGADQITIGFDPTGHTIEALQFFGNNVVSESKDNLVIQGGVFEHGGIRVLTIVGTNDIAGVGGAAPDNFKLLDCIVRQGVHAAFNLSGNMGDNRADHLLPAVSPEIGYCIIGYGGKYGQNIYQVDALNYHHNEVVRGNFMHFGSTSPNDEGSQKNGYNINSSLNNNWIHDGGAFWFDFGSHQTTVEENVFDDIYGHALWFEVDPADMVARRNYFLRCGKGTTWSEPIPFLSPGLDSSAAIFISDSPNAEADRNVFKDSDYVDIRLRGFDVPAGAPTGRYNGHTTDFLHDTWVHHNQFFHPQGQSHYLNSVIEGGGYTEGNDSASNNKFDYNEYHTATAGRLNAFHGSTHSWWRWWDTDGTKTFNGAATFVGGPWVSGDDSPGSYYDPNGSWAADY